MHNWIHITWQSQLWLLFAFKLTFFHLELFYAARGLRSDWRTKIMKNLNKKRQLKVWLPTIYLSIYSIYFVCVFFSKNSKSIVSHCFSVANSFWMFDRSIHRSIDQLSSFFSMCTSECANQLVLFVSSLLDISFHIQYILLRILSPLFWKRKINAKVYSSYFWRVAMSNYFLACETVSFYLRNSTPQIYATQILGTYSWDK